MCKKAAGEADAALDDVLMVMIGMMGRDSMTAVKVITAQH